MAAWLFTEKVLAGQPITVYNGGAMSRDFTYIDDIVEGVVRSMQSRATNPEIIAVGGGN